MQGHPGLSRLPALKLDAVASALTQFKWGDYYQRALLLLQQPRIEYAFDDQEPLPLLTRQVRLPAERPWKGVSNTAGLRLLFEQVLLHRKPYAILIDEAEHIAKAARVSKLLDQLEHLKSLAIMTRVVHILVGTYDLIVFRNLSAQLSRRSIDVHFARYRATSETKVRAFKSVLWSFQRNLPLEEEPDLLQQWKYCYERSIGFVGILKDLLTRALAEAIERGENTISPSLLEQHALSVDRCTQMVTEAATGETALTKDDQAAYRLRVRLGLETGPAGQQEQQEQHQRPQPTPRRGLRVG